MADALLRAPLIAAASAWALIALAWRGSLPWWLTLCFVCAVLAGTVPLGWMAYGWVPSDEHGLASMAYFATFAALAAAAFIWSVISLARTAQLSLREGLAWHLLPMAVLAFPLLHLSGRQTLQVTCVARVEVSDLFDQFRRKQPVDAPDSFWSSASFDYDEASATLWMRGRYAEGSATRLRRALEAHPQARVLGLAGPGGLVREASAMAEMILKRDLDTYAPADCASACTTVFAAGAHRWIEPTTRLGLHRSGHRCMKDSGPSPLDEHEAAYLRARGVSDPLVDRFLNTPYRQMHVPSHAELIVSGLATHEGKPVARQP